jgi:hypothetical protein
MDQQRAQYIEALKYCDSLSPGPIYMIWCLSKSLQEAVTALDSRSQASNLLGSNLLLKVTEIDTSPKGRKSLGGRHKHWQDSQPVERGLEEEVKEEKICAGSFTEQN